MVIIERIKNSDGLISGFTVNGSTYSLKIPISDLDLNSAIMNSEPLLLVDDTLFAFSRGGGSSSTTGGSTALLRYVLENNKLTIGTELTQADPSIPQVVNNKGFLTGTSQTALLDFYKAFAYNEVNYELMVNSPNIEISFLCSDRRYGVAGSRRAWSPYFKLSDLEKTTFTLIQNDLVGSDLTAAYNIQGKITRNASGALFITLTDTHAGNNLFGAVLNIRHRVI